MHDFDRESSDLIQFIRAQPQGISEILGQASEFSTREADTIRGGVRRLPEPIQELVERLVADWQKLEVAERIAALLAIASLITPGAARTARRTQTNS